MKGPRLIYYIIEKFTCFGLIQFKSKQVFVSLFVRKTENAVALAGDIGCMVGGPAGSKRLRI